MARPPSKRHHADHKNRNCTDNKASNLRWRTPKQNYETRNHANGERHGRAKLTERQVSEIRRRAKREFGNELAVEFGVWPGTINNIIHGKTWKGIEARNG